MSKLLTSEFISFLCILASNILVGHSVRAKINYGVTMTIHRLVLVRLGKASTKTKCETLALD